jgi:hypothetical protein
LMLIAVAAAAAFAVPRVIADVTEDG